MMFFVPPESNQIQGMMIFINGYYLTRVSDWGILRVIK